MHVSIIFYKGNIETEVIFMLMTINAIFSINLPSVCYPFAIPFFSYPFLVFSSGHFQIEIQHSKYVLKKEDYTT